MCYSGLFFLQHMEKMDRYETELFEEINKGDNLSYLAAN